jgi:cobalamin biosynthesis protein CobW
MNELTKIPVTIITGFLGSGKTTLISHLMKNPQGKKLAIIVNEFGTLGIDGDILKNCADENCPLENIVELSNGCICCTVADDFIPTMDSLLSLKEKPDHIIIETSGLALPKPLLKAFSWPDIKSKITVDGVIAIADAEAVSEGRFAPDIDAVNTQRLEDPSIDHETPLSEVFEDQVSCADIILLSKTDLIDENGIRLAREIIAKETKASVSMIEIANGVVDPKLILGLDANAELDLHNRPSHHDGFDDHEHDDFDTVVIQIEEISDIDQLKDRIANLAEKESILRIKGFVAVKDKPMRLLVQAVGKRVRTQFDRPWGDSPRQSNLVVIAEKDHINKDKIITMLSQ